MRRIAHIVLLALAWVLLVAGMVGTHVSGSYGCIGYAILCAFVVLVIDFIVINRPKAVATWIAVGSVALVGQFYLAKYATETDKDPDLEPTIQFTPDMYPQVAALITPEGLDAHVRALSGVPSRLTGTPGCDRAAEYIMQQFRAFGVGDPQIQEFPVTVPVADTTELRTPLGTLPVYPLYPNGICPAATPEGGLQTRLVYAGFGRLADVNGKDIDGATVVVETGAREQWLYLVDLGAEAVIFVERERPPRAMELFTQTGSHQNVPRFWMTRNSAGALLDRLKSEDIEATLVSDARWEQRVGKNLWIDLPGVSTAAHNEHEVVVIEAYYDSSSFVPKLAPGAEQACGIATLLELGKVIRKHPFEKRVRLLATSGHFQALEGARQYVWEHVGQYETSMRDVSPRDHAAFFSLDLSSRSERVGLFFGGHYFAQVVNNLKPRLSDLGRRATDYVAGREDRGITGIAEVMPWDATSVFVDTINPVAGKDWPNYMPAPLMLNHEPALLAGIPALAFVTTNDTRLFAGTPNDIEVNIDKLTVQAQLLACLLPNAFNVEGRYLKRSLPRSICRVKGRAVYFDPHENYLPDKAVEDALIMVRRQGDVQPFLGGVAARSVLTADANGEFELVAVGTTQEVPPHRALLSFEPFKVNRGRITWAPDFGNFGNESYPSKLNPVQKEMELTCVAFACRTLEIYNLFDPRNYNSLTNLVVLEAESNSIPHVYGTTITEAGWPSYILAPTATVYAPEGTRLKMTASSGPAQKRLVLLNVDEADESAERFRSGEGFLIDETPSIRRTYLQSARDMWRLNDSRIRFFGSHGIDNARVTRLHDLAGTALEKAETALEEKDYQRHFTEARRALSLESRAYPDVVGMASDTVRGLRFYLALLLPFACTMERLFVAG
ncbi:MAG: hypothetical protein GY851_07180, partial [bacterium]|nr:hypothetical protein [bacterium]